MSCSYCSSCHQTYVYKCSSISRRSQIREMKKNISFCSQKRSVNIIPQNKHWWSWWTLWNKGLEEISFDILLIYFVCYTQKCSRKVSWKHLFRVSLNCQSDQHFSDFPSTCPYVYWVFVKKKKNSSLSSG